MSHFNLGILHCHQQYILLYFVNFSIFTGLMPLPSGLPTLPKLPNVDINLQNLAPVTLPGIGAVPPLTGKFVNVLYLIYIIIVKYLIIIAK